MRHALRSFDGFRKRLCRALDRVARKTFVEDLALKSGRSGNGGAVEIAAGGIVLVQRVNAYAVDAGPGRCC